MVEVILYAELHNVKHLLNTQRHESHDGHISKTLGWYQYFVSAKRQVSTISIEQYDFDYVAKYHLQQSQTMLTINLQVSVAW